MVEFNTIASSMGGHAVGIGEMHKSIGTLPKYCCAKDNNVLTATELIYPKQTGTKTYVTDEGKQYHLYISILFFQKKKSVHNYD